MTNAPDSSPATLPAALRTAAAAHPDLEAIVDGPRRMSYGELATEARRAGAAFVASGVQPGDRVSIWAPNSADWIVAYFGLSSAGAVLVPLNTRYQGAEAADILRRSQAGILVTVDNFLGRDYPALLEGHDLPALREQSDVRREMGGLPDPRADDPAHLAEVDRRVGSPRTGATGWT